MSAIEAAHQGLLYVGGQWRSAASGATFAVWDPGNEQELAQVADADVGDGLAAVDAAEAAAGDWAATPPRARAELLRRAYELMQANKADLARLISQENGKAYGEALGEVDYASEFLRWFSEEAPRALGSIVTSPNGQYEMMIRLVPVGISLFVTPWNFPAAMATRKIGPALAAGCTTILKPAAATPLTALAMADLFAQAGVPAGVVNVVPTARTGPLVEAIMADERVRKISFTGSTAVGKRLLEQASRSVMRASMELGGNAPFIVLDDADLDLAVANALIAKLRNVGQSCVAANRFYVHAAVAEEFCARFAAELATVKVGYPLDEGVTLGALIDAEAREKVLALVADAVDRGGRLLTGGKALDGPGWFMEPTLIADVPADARCLQEEIFGPLAAVSTFESDEEVVAVANGTPYGLIAYLQSGDLRRALALADRMDTGMVGINKGVISDPAAPFGGRKESGLGREGGHEGLMEYLETKYVAATW